MRLEQFFTVNSTFIYFLHIRNDRNKWKSFLFLKSDVEVKSVKLLHSICSKCIYNVAHLHSRSTILKFIKSVPMSSFYFVNLHEDFWGISRGFFSIIYCHEKGISKCYFFHETFIGNDKCEIFLSIFLL